MSKSHPKKEQEQEERKPIPIDGLKCAHCGSNDIREMVRNYRSERALKCFGCGRSWGEQVKP